MKKTILSLTTIVFLLICSNGIQAQNATKDFDQLKLAQKYLVGTWQTTRNDTTWAWELKQDGKVLFEIDYIIVNGKKSVDSYWSYSYEPERNNFYMFAAYVSGKCITGIGSFTAENKWCQELFVPFNPEKILRKGEFVFDTPTSLTLTVFNSEGVKLGEGKVSKVE
ncbi:MAG: hypothetical protein RBT02_07795 [Bacteroidales bacterium]|jgi:hypothetical protein|nr:hypothetical protein [Bacteroidales bacterium]